MCYMIVTGRSLTWFLLTLVATMLAISAIVTPKWLIGAEVIKIPSNFTIYKHPSVGIYTRCKMTERHGYHCGRFDLFGFATEDSIYPLAWKATMFFISAGFFLLCATVVLTILTCFRQSVFGKSIHNLTGSAQVLSGILIMISLFLHPLGWGANRVIRMCGPDAEAFYPAECSIGWAMWAAVASAVLCFFCAGISLTAESANMSSKVRRRVEDGDRLVCVP